MEVEIKFPKTEAELILVCQMASQKGMLMACHFKKYPYPKVPNFLRKDHEIEWQIGSSTMTLKPLENWFLVIDVLRDEGLPGEDLEEEDLRTIYRLPNFNEVNGIVKIT